MAFCIASTQKDASSVFESQWASALRPQRIVWRITEMVCHLALQSRIEGILYISSNQEPSQFSITNRINVPGEIKEKTLLLLW